jgi:hypothetical protein
MSAEKVVNRAKLFVTPGPHLVFTTIFCLRVTDALEPQQLARRLPDGCRRGPSPSLSNYCFPTAVRLQ